MFVVNIQRLKHFSFRLQITGPNMKDTNMKLINNIL